jgi:hypothetical protein
MTCRNRYLIWQPVSESSLRVKAQIGQKPTSTNATRAAARFDASLAGKCIWPGCHQGHRALNRSNE